ncbi:hypothetical protein K438DRAFT_1771763 [Mycena galopus ATCC 62051]|nr:hypothetical protein K438DRAFT_1771763 [Mycena galopus ATCC 62051]
MINSGVTGGVKVGLGERVPQSTRRLFQTLWRSYPVDMDNLYAKRIPQLLKLAQSRKKVRFHDAHHPLSHHQNIPMTEVDVEYRQRMRREAQRQRRAQENDVSRETRRKHDANALCLPYSTVLWTKKNHAAIRTRIAGRTQKSAHAANVKTACHADLRHNTADIRDFELRLGSLDQILSTGGTVEVRYKRAPLSIFVRRPGVQALAEEGHTAKPPHGLTLGSRSGEVTNMLDQALA